MAIATGPPMNFSAIAYAVNLGPQVSVFSCDAMNNPIVFCNINSIHNLVKYIKKKRENLNYPYCTWPSLALRRT